MERCETQTGLCGVLLIFKGWFRASLQAAGAGSMPAAKSENEVRTLTPRPYRWLMERPKAEQPEARRAAAGRRMTERMKSVEKDGRSPA